MGANSTGSYRIFTGLIVVLGALFFLSASAGASCPEGYYADHDEGYCWPKLNNRKSNGAHAVNCSGPCDRCGSARRVVLGEIGGPAGGCKTCSHDSVCTVCGKVTGCLDPNAPAKPGTVNTTPSAGQTYNPIHRLKIKPSSDASGSQGASPCLPPHILYNNGNCGCPSGLTGANCGDLVVN